jgi:hypothetical protein
MPHPKREFPECVDCINKEFDPFQCETCIDGSNFEGEDDDASEELTYAEFIDLFREAA